MLRSFAEQLQEVSSQAATNIQESHAMPEVVEPPEWLAHEAQILYDELRANCSELAATGQITYKTKPDITGKDFPTTREVLLAAEEKLMEDGFWTLFQVSDIWQEVQGDSGKSQTNSYRTRPAEARIEIRWEAYAMSVAVERNAKKLSQNRLRRIANSGLLFSDQTNV